MCYDEVGLRGREVVNHFWVQLVTTLGGLINPMTQRIREIFCFYSHNCDWETERK